MHPVFALKFECPSLPGQARRLAPRRPATKSPCNLTRPYRATPPKLENLPATMRFPFGRRSIGTDGVVRPASRIECAIQGAIGAEPG